MADLPEARVAHLTTGRLRVKIPEKRGDEGFFRSVAERLGGWDSIERVEVNPRTASVLVHFPELAALFAENALKNDLFAVSYDDLLADNEPAGSVTEWATQRVAEADAAVKRWTTGRADIRAAVFLFLVGSGLIQLMRGNISAPAATLFWYAGAMLRLWDVLPEVKEAVKEG